jgi:hypothetical protein
MHPGVFARSRRSPGGSKPDRAGNAPTRSSVLPAEILSRVLGDPAQPQEIDLPRRGPGSRVLPHRGDQRFSVFSWHGGRAGGGSPSRASGCSAGRAGVGRPAAMAVRPRRPPAGPFAPAGADHSLRVRLAVDLPHGLGNTSWEIPSHRSVAAPRPAPSTAFVGRTSAPACSPHTRMATSACTRTLHPSVDANSPGRSARGYAAHSVQRGWGAVRPPGRAPRLRARRGSREPWRGNHVRQDSHRRSAVAPLIPSVCLVATSSGSRTAEVPPKVPSGRRRTGWGRRTALHRRASPS